MKIYSTIVTIIAVFAMYLSYSLIQENLFMENVIEKSESVEECSAVKEVGYIEGHHVIVETNEESFESGYKKGLSESNPELSGNELISACSKAGYYPAKTCPEADLSEYITEVECADLIGIAEAVSYNEGSFGFSCPVELCETQDKKTFIELNPKWTQNKTR